MKSYTMVGASALALALFGVNQAPVFAQAGQPMPAAEAAAAFGSRERILDASLSPDGTRLALVVPGPKQATVVQVVDLASGEAKAVNYADGDPMTLTNCGWVSNKRLLCYLYGVSNVGGGPWIPYTRMIAMDADGTNATPLGAMEKTQYRAQQSDGHVIDWRDGSTDTVLITRRYLPARASLNRIGNITEGLAVDLIDTRTAKVDHIESADPIAHTYIGDGQGHVRIKGVDEAFKFGYQTRGETKFFYRTKDSDAWRPFSTYNGVTEEGLYPVGVDAAGNTAYALKKTNGRDALYRVALDGSLKEELAFAHPKVDVLNVARVGRSGRIVGARYSEEAVKITYFDPGFEKLEQGLRKALPRTPIVNIVDSSADEKRHLVYAGSDLDAGQYYLFDSEKRSLTPVGEVRPQAAGAPMGVMKPITYKAADGTDVPAYLTLPPGGTGKNLPAIVMPHGGPAARDHWGFDWLVQFFVTRGYAVLQPNFRGSSGYGDEWFQENGFKSWKAAIGDVTDAGRWLVKQGIADPAKLAIVGWSYGGYAALQSNAVDPDLFKAVVAIAPVTDLNLLRSEQRGFTNMRVAQDYVGEGPHLIEGSPARQAAKFKAPVLMFHGDKDINVNVDEAKLMDRQLKSAGKSSELVIYPKIDHQLADSAVRVDMLTKADAFLSKALKR